MTAGDEEALSWEGDSDSSHVSPPTAKTTRTKDVAPAPTAPLSAVEASGPSSVLLVSYGILGGMYLLYTVGWLVTVLGDNRKPYADVLTEVMYQSGEYLAIASPALWFGTALLFTRGRKPISRLLVLVLGLLLVIPWPFVLLGA